VGCGDVGVSEADGLGRSGTEHHVSSEAEHERIRAVDQVTSTSSPSCSDKRGQFQAAEAGPRTSTTWA
jgi:hypothetical protein